MVLHDINQACRYATHLIAMSEGPSSPRPPATVVTAELIQTVFGLPCHVIADPATGTPLVIPAAPRGHVNGDGSNGSSPG